MLQVRVCPVSQVSFLQCRGAPGLPGFTKGDLGDGLTVPHGGGGGRWCFLPADILAPVLRNRKHRGGDSDRFDAGFILSTKVISPRVVDKHLGQHSCLFTTEPRSLGGLEKGKLRTGPASCSIGRWAQEGSTGRNAEKEQGGDRASHPAPPGTLLALGHGLRLMTLSAPDTQKGR